MSPRLAAVVVLAAGEGTRMKSSVPKVMHELAGRTLVGHAVAAASALQPDHLVVVVGHGREQVADHLAATAPGAAIAVQDRQLGTGHAVACALDTMPQLEGVVVVTYGDVPLLTPDTLTDLVARHVDDGNAVTVLTAEVADATGYGRIVRDADGGVRGIVEHQDATPDVLGIREINSGIYAFDAAVLSSCLSRLSTDNAQGELYLTDVLGMARTDGRRVGAHATNDSWQTEGVNDRVQLAALHRELNRRVLERWMRAGVTVIDPAATWVDVTVKLGRDVVLRPGVQLQGATVVDDGAEIGPDSTLVDCVVGAGASVARTHARGAEIGPECSVGPFTYLRPGARLARAAKAGAFVEIKASTLGEGSKVPHLSYVGDAEIGARSNIGAATVIVNYDGVAKHRTVIGEHVRIGSDTMLVAPVTIGDGAYTAAGSVITTDVPPGAMAVARARQRNVEDWVARKRAGTPAADAAARAKAGQTGGDPDAEGSSP
ncbi:MAG TPA: bifunctional UDP-N-acetylglucosamine diphosphorylase/glucosamine-1-phosphate N-acetyltransferase GlmU [Jiangellaceae bacterium]|nr:bifunctional UDP-N-acetylglucosamine diphosphorylase/glucosamine-1-phosphate N-acetyltransferase GlmU [Jiangellaceae bacterium]